MSMVGGAFLTSCGDNFLDTKSPSSLDDKNIFSIYDLAKGTVYNIYTYYGEQNYRARFTSYYGMNTDVEWFNGSDKSDDKANMATYNVSPNNGQLNIADAKEPWSNIYSGIEKANLAIAGLKQYAELSSDANLRQLYGEALTLRAMAYVDLITTWGDVPARFEPITPETVNLPRTDRDVIYKQIIADLREAQDMVAWPNELEDTKTVERINKAFVKGLLARTCLYAAGSALRADGTVRTSNDPELSKDVLYPIALQACKDVMDQEGRYVKLESKFETVFKNNCQDVIDAGGESLWEIPFANEPSARGRMAYDFAIKHTTTDDFVGAKQGGNIGPLPYLYFDYDVKDLRRDITCIPYDWTKGVQNILNKNVSTWYFGKIRYEWMSRKISSSDDGINKIYMRYADVILMRAEVENYLNGASAAAPYLKQIRQRAFAQADWAEKVDKYVTDRSSKEAMQLAIEKERGFEFAGEMIRKNDLVRWGKLKANLDLAKEKMTQLSMLDGDYTELSGFVFFKMTDFTDGADKKVHANTAIEIWGLNRGQKDINEAPAGFEQWTDNNGERKEWISEKTLKESKIESLYTRDPDMYMYWPIFQYNLDANPELKNYDWYNN